MSENSEDWRDYRESQKKRRKERLPIRVAEIMSLPFKVQKLTEYQFRVEDKVDLFPVHRRYHILKTGKRGDYKNLIKLINSVTTKIG